LVMSTEVMLAKSRIVSKFFQNLDVVDSILFGQQYVYEHNEKNLPRLFSFASCDKATSFCSNSAWTVSAASYLSLAAFLVRRETMLQQARICSRPEDPPNRGTSAVPERTRYCCDFVFLRIICSSSAWTVSAASCLSGEKGNNVTTSSHLLSPRGPS
jgi:hypothetical protein